MTEEDCVTALQKV